MLNYSAYNNLVNLRNANKANKAYTDLSFNNVFIDILDYFYKTGYIEGYTYLTFAKVRVFLKYYEEKGLLNGLSFYLDNPSFSFKHMKYIFYGMQLNQYVYYFTTSKGWATLEEIFHKRLNIGGILYFFLALR